MPHSPLVSIITPSFNQAPFLEETILSVLRQDYTNIEYIIMDGGSTDGSQEVIRKYSSHLAHWRSERDAGQTDALVRGFTLAKGDYLAYLCSDDVLEPSSIAISVDYHLMHKDVGLTFGDRIRMDAIGNIYSLQRYPRFRPWFLRSFFNIPQETTLFKRSVFDAAGGLDPSLQMVMDYDLWCKINNISTIHHIPAVLGRFRSYPDTKSTRFSKQFNQNRAGQLTSEHIMVYRRHFGARPNFRLLPFYKYCFGILALSDRYTTTFRAQALRCTQIRLSGNRIQR